MLRSQESLIRDLQLDSNPQIRTDAAKALAKYPSQATIDALLKAAMTDPAAPVQNVSVRSLRQLDPERAFQIFATAARSPDRETCARALTNLMRLGDQRAIPLCIDKLHDYDSDVRQVAAQALGRLGGQESIGPLTVAYTYDLSSEVRQAAQRALQVIQRRLDRQRLRPKPVILEPKPIW